MLRLDELYSLLEDSLSDLNVNLLTMVVQLQEETGCRNWGKPGTGRISAFPAVISVGIFWKVFQHEPFILGYFHSSQNFW